VVLVSYDAQSIGQLLVAISKNRNLRMLTIEMTTRRNQKSHGNVQIVKRGSIPINLQQRNIEMSQIEEGGNFFYLRGKMNRQFLQSRTTYQNI